MRLELCVEACGARTRRNQNQLALRRNRQIPIIRLFVVAVDTTIADDPTALADKVVCYVRPLSEHIHNKACTQRAGLLNPQGNVW